MSAPSKPANLRPLTVRAAGALVVLLAFFSWIWAVALLPFANVLPYLQERSLAERALLSAAFFAFASSAAWWGQTPKQWKSFSSSHLNGWKGKLGMLVALIFLTYSTAELSANIWGSLAKLSPGRPYSESHEVMAAKASGSKYSSVELQLRGQDRKIRFLTLSRKLFDYPKFQAGEVVLLYGKRTVFGVYVSEFRHQ
jgi:hypothetical protein